VLAASLVLLALVAGMVGTTVGMLHAERRRIDAEQAQQREAEQRDKAERARDRTRQALDAMTSSMTGDSLTTQKAISEEQKKFLTEVLTYYREFAGEKGDDELSRARTAEEAYRVGFIESRLGRKEEAVTAFLQARDGYAELAAEFPAVPQYRISLARSHNFLGMMLADLGKPREAERQFRQALDLQEKLTAEFLAVPQHQQFLARIHNNLGGLMYRLGKQSEAEKHFRQALALREKLITEFPAVPEYRIDLSKSHGNLGVLLGNLGKFPEAERQNRKALDLQEKLTADFPAVPEYREHLAGGHNNLGLLLAVLGKQSEAEQHYRKALDLQEKLAADFPAMPEYQIGLGGSYCNYGNLVSAGKRPSESLTWYEKTIRTLTAVYEQDRRLVVPKEYLRNSYWGRARAYTRLRKYAEALKDWDKAIELSPKAKEPEFRAARATTRIQAGQMAEAVAEVAELTKLSNWNAAQSYDFACVYAVASSNVADTKQEYAERAVQLLHQAVKAGYTDAAHMQEDSDLDSLRGRDDFKKLMHELQKKSAARKEKQP
jgi:tetratricopeptide (TPR) repeat protein